MRNQSPFFRHTGVLAVATMLAFGAGSVSAQEASSHTATTNEPSKGVPVEPAYDLEIKNGTLFWKGKPRADKAEKVPATLENVVDQLRELYPESNFVIGPGLGNTSIADLKLHKTSLAEKLDALDIATGKSIVWSGNQDANGRFLVTITEAPRRADAAPALQVEAFGIGEYLAGVVAAGTGDKAALVDHAIDEIHNIVDETVHDYNIINGRYNPARKNQLRGVSLQFHRGANLLVVIGEPEAVMVVGKVIGALPGVRFSSGLEPEFRPPVKPQPRF